MTEQELRAQDARLTQLIEELVEAAHDSLVLTSSAEVEAARDALHEYIASIRVLPRPSAGEAPQLSATAKE